MSWGESGFKSQTQSFFSFPLKRHNIQLVISSKRLHLQRYEGVKTPLVLEMFQVLGPHFEVGNIIIRDRTNFQKIN